MPVTPAEEIITAVGCTKGVLTLVPCRVTDRTRFPDWCEIAPLGVADPAVQRLRWIAYAERENIGWAWGRIDENSDKGRALMAAFALTLSKEDWLPANGV